jgi:virginiamycin A acetyltransferase
MFLLKDIIRSTLLYKLSMLIYFKIYYPTIAIQLRTKLNFADILNGKLKIGNNVRIGNDVILEGKVVVGDYTYFSDGYTEINAEQGEIEIGKYCAIARNVFFRTTQHHINGLMSSPEYFKRIGIEYPKNSKYLGSIIIGNDVWIGANVTILGGVTIGDGAIIGANSLVNKNVPSFAVVGGIPAKFIRWRFTDETKNLISKLKPWDLSIELLRNTKLFYD